MKKSFVILFILACSSLHAQTGPGYIMTNSGEQHFGFIEVDIWNDAALVRVDSLHSRTFHSSTISEVLVRQVYQE